MTADVPEALDVPYLGGLVSVAHRRAEDRSQPARQHNCSSPIRWTRTQLPTSSTQPAPQLGVRSAPALRRRTRRHSSGKALKSADVHFAPSDTKARAPGGGGRSILSRHRRPRAAGSDGVIGICRIKERGGLSSHKRRYPPTPPRSGLPRRRKALRTVGAVFRLRISAAAPAQRCCSYRLA